VSLNTGSSFDELNLDQLNPDQLSILVPAGAEYKAVKKGVRSARTAYEIIAVPAGQAITGYLRQLKKAQQLKKNVLLMGLGGGLVPDCAVGRSRLLSQVWDASSPASKSDSLSCDQMLSAQIAARLPETDTAIGAMSNQVLTTVAQKQALGDRYPAQVVDMESFSLLQTLPDHNVAILRIISDNCAHDLPNIAQAIRPNGSLDTTEMTIRFIQRPIAAARFIAASLKGLSQLEKIAARL